MILERIKPFKLAAAGRIKPLGNGQIIMFQIKKTNAYLESNYVSSITPLNSLRVFEAAARHLSFTRAAEELFVTQAAVSRRSSLPEDANVEALPEERSFAVD